MRTFLSLLAAGLMVTFTSPVFAQQPHEKIFDHFTCYKIKCATQGHAQHGQYEECPKFRKKVLLYNQFTERQRDYPWDDYHPDDPRDRKERALEVYVLAPELLCVPTHKDHANQHGDYPDHEEPEPEPAPHGR
jgi:hypothetical protein